MSGNRSPRARTWPKVVSSSDNASAQDARHHWPDNPSSARKALPSTTELPGVAPEQKERLPCANASTSKTDSHRRSTLGITLRWWMPELLASFMSIISLLAIVAVLVVYDGHSLDSLELPRQLSLNGLVAILATLHRMFLAVPLGSFISQQGWLHFAKSKRKPHYLRDLPRFGDAADGAWGSLLFILRSPRQYLTLIAAVVTVISLGISTFVQQLIAFENVPLRQLTSSLQPGNAPRAEFFNDYVGAPGQGSLVPSLTMRAAIYNGMMTQNIKLAQAHCPSGNCTWPLTPSLAMCGDCAPTTPFNQSCEQGYCVYTMPSGTTFSLYEFGSAGYEGTGFEVQSGSGGKHWNASSPDRLYIANWEQIGAPYGSLGPGTSADAYTFTECALWFCINTYNISTQFGTQSAHLVSSYHHIDHDWYDQDHIGNDEYTYIVPNASVDPATNYSVSYNVSIFGMDGMVYIASLLNGTVELNDRGYFASDDVTEAVWNGGGSPGWVKNLAVSISNVIREEAQANRAMFDGTASVQGVRVRWWWISLPAAAVVISIGLLAVVMFRTANDEISAWKSNPLTPLFLEVDDELKSAVNARGYLHEVDGMDKIGRQRVTLRKTEKGSWIFEGAS